MRQAAGASLFTVDAMVRAREARGRTASPAARAGPPPFVKSGSDPIMHAARGGAFQPSLPRTHQDDVSRSIGSEGQSVLAWMENGSVPTRGRKNSLDELQDGLASLFGNLFGADVSDANSAAGTQADPSFTVVIGPDAQIRTSPVTRLEAAKSGAGSLEARVRQLEKELADARISPVQQRVTRKNSGPFTSEQQDATPRSSGPARPVSPIARTAQNWQTVTVQRPSARTASVLEPDWVLKAQQAVEKARMISSAQGTGSGI